MAGDDTSERELTTLQGRSSQGVLATPSTLDSTCNQYNMQQPGLNLGIRTEPHLRLFAPENFTARLITREFNNRCGGRYRSGKDRQFLYSRFESIGAATGIAGVGNFVTCISFLEDSSQLIVGTSHGDLMIFCTYSEGILEDIAGHKSSVTRVQSCYSGGRQFVLSSSSNDVKLWEPATIHLGARQSISHFKNAQLSNSGNLFAAVASKLPQTEVRLYNIETFQLNTTLPGPASGVSGPGHLYSSVHFHPHPDDNLLLWNERLYDTRQSQSIHHFNGLTDYGGGGFHPAGNQVIINSEVFDLRNFRSLRSVPSLDHTQITFNASGSVIYATLRRNIDKAKSAFKSSRIGHTLCKGFRTLDAGTYSDIADIPRGHVVLDIATEPTDSRVAVAEMKPPVDKEFGIASYNPIQMDHRIVLLRIGRKNDI